jgi:hypothetical protein
LREGYSGDDNSTRKKQEGTGEKSTIRSFIISTLRNVSATWVDKIKKNEMGWACGTHARDNIKGKVVKMRTGLIWLSARSSGEL